MTLHARDWFARLSHLRSVHPEWTTEPAAVRDQSGHSGNPRDCPHGAITRVMHGTWTEAMEAHSASTVDLFNEAFEELNPVLLAEADGVVSLAPEDGQELGPGLEEPAALADGLEAAVEPDGPSAVSVPEQAAVLSGDASHVGPLDAGR